MTAPTNADAETTPSRAVVVSDACSRRLCGRCGEYENQCTCKARCPEPFVIGDGKRFHWRVYGSEKGQRYEVYSIGMDQWAECADAERAEAIASALESFYANAQGVPAAAGDTK